MSCVAYVDGQYLPHRSVGVPIEDRGYQFANGVYEVLAVVGGRLADGAPCLARLARLLSELRITRRWGDAALRTVMREVIRRNRVHEYILYPQVSRGVTPREHAFPRSAKPVLVVTLRSRRAADPHLAETALAVITIPDNRFPERAFNVVEAKGASEAFLTRTAVDLSPIVSIKGAPIANGIPGSLTRRLRDRYLPRVPSAA